MLEKIFFRWDAASCVGQGLAAMTLLSSQDDYHIINALMLWPSGGLDEGVTGCPLLSTSSNIVHTEHRQPTEHRYTEDILLDRCLFVGISQKVMNIVIYMSATPIWSEF